MTLSFLSLVGKLRFSWTLDTTYMYIEVLTYTQIPRWYWEMIVFFIEFKLVWMMAWLHTYDHKYKWIAETQQTHEADFNVVIIYINQFLNSISIFSKSKSQQYFVQEWCSKFWTQIPQMCCLWRLTLDLTLFSFIIKWHFLLYSKWFCLLMKQLICSMQTSNISDENV